MKRLFAAFISGIGILFFLGDMSQISAQGSADEEFTLEEITVTAQKREENQQKVPIMMDSISGDKIKELGQNDIDQILSNIAGAIVNKAGDGLRISLRGLSQDSGGNVGPQSSSPTVAVNIDGVFSQRNSNTGNLYDMERVEVLYGPQSTLYASNSPGGIVNIITANPKTDRYEASGSLEYGNFNLLRTEGSINAPVSDNMALRAAFTTSTRDGYLNNGVDNEDIKSARIKAFYEPNERISFLLTVEFLKDSSLMGFASAVKEFVDQDDTDNPWTAATTTPPSPNNQIQKKISGRIDWDLGFGSLTLMPDYTKTDNNTSRTSLSFTGSEVTDDISQQGYEKGVEGRMVSSESSIIKWIGGVNWYKSEDAFLRSSSDGGGEDAINRNKSYAFYGNVTFPVSDRFRISGGARMSWDNAYQYTLRIPQMEVVEASFDHTGKDFMAGGEYDIGENSMLYGNISTGYRAQLAQAVDANGEAFPPESINSFTIGSKNRFFGNKLQLNASGYYYKYEDYLAIDMVPSVADENGNGVKDPGEDTMQPDDNAKQAADLNIMGIDIQTSAIITQKDILDVSVSYLKTEFTRLSFDYWPITNSMGIPDQDLTGAEKTNSPHWTINAAYSHNFYLGNSGVLTARFDSRYQSSYILTWQEKSFFGGVTDITKVRTQEAYHVTNFSAIYAHPDGKWTFTGYIKNLEDYAVKKSWISGLMIIGSPRTYGAILSVKY